MIQKKTVSIVLSVFHFNSAYTNLINYSKIRKI